MGRQTGRRVEEVGQFCLRIHCNTFASLFHFSPLKVNFSSLMPFLRYYTSVVVTSPKLTLMAALIGEVHSNFGTRNSVCRLLRIFIAQNINIVY